MTDCDQLSEDMHNHFGERLRWLVSNTANTCLQGGMTKDDTMQMLVSVLIFEAAFAAGASGLPADSFTEMNDVAYKLVHEYAEAKMKRRRH